MPTARRTLSGVAIALFMALRIQFGLAANIKPSSTNRMPKPMRKSANAMDLIGLEPPVVLFLSGRGAAELPPLSSLRFRRRRGRRLAGRVTKEPEEIRVRPQQEAGVARLEPVLIGRHRPVEGEEIGVPAVSFRKQTVALGVAHAARLLGLGPGFRLDHGRLAV